MLTTQIARTNIVLPNPELITVTPVRDALNHALAARDVRNDAAREFALADADLDNIRRIELARQAEILSADPTQVIPDSTEAVDAAEKRVRVARARLEALDVVVDRAVGSLRSTIEKRAEAWAKKSVKATEKALGELAAAVALADAAREKLYASVGVLGMLRALPEDGQLAIRHAPHGYTFSIDSAMAGLDEAVKSAKKELAAHATALGLAKAATPPSEVEIIAEPDSDFEIAPDDEDDDEGNDDE